MKTEEDARKTECRIGAIAAAIITASARDDMRDEEMAIGDHLRVCIGSKCGHWRQTVGIYDRQESRFVRPNESWSTSARYEERFRPEGYCGLAGKP